MVEGKLFIYLMMTTNFSKSSSSKEVLILNNEHFTAVYGPATLASPGTC